MNTTRTLALTATTLATVALLAGCTTTPETGPTETPAASATPTPEPEATTAPLPRSADEAIEAAYVVAADFYEAYSEVRRTDPTDTTPLEAYADKRGISAYQNQLNSQIDGGWTVEGEVTFELIEDGGTYTGPGFADDGETEIPHGTVHLIGCTDASTLARVVPGEEPEPATNPFMEVQVSVQYLSEEEQWKVVGYRQLLENGNSVDTRCEK